MNTAERNGGDTHPKKSTAVAVHPTIPNAASMPQQFDIWPVLEHYGWTLPAPRGVWQSVRCHVHDDKHASCRVSQDAGVIKCLGCEFKGSAIDVVRHYEGIG